MDIKTKRNWAGIVIAVATFFGWLAIANFIYRDYDLASFLIMAFVGSGCLISFWFAAKTFEATKDEAAQEYQERIKELEKDGYAISTSQVTIVPYLNTREIKGKNLLGTVQVIGKEKFDDQKITILLDSFMLSETKVETSVCVSTIRFKEYVVIYDTLNKQAVWLLK